MVDNVRLPDRIESGARGGPRFQTTISTARSGREDRNIDWLVARREYDISYGIATRDDYQEVLSFFMARRGRARSFLFDDHLDNAVTAEVIGTGDGSETDFQLTRTYPDTAAAYIRDIDYPKTGFTVSVNGSPTTSFTRVKGLLTFSSPPANGHLVTWTGGFYTPVRFNTDLAQFLIEWEEAAALPAITLIEVFGE